MNKPTLTPEQLLLNQIENLILEVANLYDEVPTSDLQGIATVKAHEILHLMRAQPISSDPVVVQYWNSVKYVGKSGEQSTADFEMSIDDKRHTGKLFVDIQAVGGAIDDVLPATFEINRLPGSESDTQCLHLHFDESNMAASFFKQGDAYIIRPETDVSITPFVLPNGERGWKME